MAKMTLNLAKDDRKKAAVISHERSGTHFLMNSLALNFEYITNPWWNLDFEQGINFHAPQSLLDYFKQVHDKPVLNILKSHHPFEFFKDFIEYFADQFFIFYIYRDPRDIMVSNWKLINHFHSLRWDEGPKTTTVGDFLRSAPCSAMLRYQKRQEETVLHRWQSHVEGWINFAGENTQPTIMTLRYEDLNLKYEKTIKEIGKFIGLTVTDPKRPSRHNNVIKPGKGKVNTYKEYLSPSDNEFVLNIVGGTMNRLGYF